MTMYKIMQHVPLLKHITLTYSKILDKFRVISTNNDMWQVPIWLRMEKWKTKPNNFWKIKRSLLLQSRMSYWLIKMFKYSKTKMVGFGFSFIYIYIYKIVVAQKAKRCSSCGCNEMKCNLWNLTLSGEVDGGDLISMFRSLFFSIVVCFGGEQNREVLVLKADNILHYPKQM